MALPNISIGDLAKKNEQSATRIEPRPQIPQGAGLTHVTMGVWTRSSSTCTPQPPPRASSPAPFASAFTEGRSPTTATTAKAAPSSTSTNSSPPPLSTPLDAHDHPV